MEITVNLNVVHHHGGPPPAGDPGDVLPFAAAAPDDGAGLPPGADPADPKGLDPATLALLLALGKIGLELLAKWLERRRKSAA